MSRFWAEHPTAMWSRIFRQLYESQGLRSLDGSRLLAMLYLTAADALIGCWDDKAYWGYWRPITAIREAGTDQPGHEGRSGLAPADSHAALP